MVASASAGIQLPEKDEIVRFMVSVLWRLIGAGISEKASIVGERKCKSFHPANPLSVSPDLMCSRFVPAASRVFALSPATVLVFLPAAAGARVVAADFRAGPNWFRLFHRSGGFADNVAGIP